MSRQKPDVSPGLREAVKPAARQATTKADQVKQSTPAHFNMNHALMLEVFREPISFHPTYVEFTGSVTAALLLSYACYTSDQLNDEYPGFDGWFHKRQVDWTRETGLSRRELESSRLRLRALGLLEEKRAGAPPVLLCRVDFTRLNDLMNRQAQANWAQILPTA